MKKIQILMSTYNGERYLREQLDSIASQDCGELGLAEISLLVRDDGSADGTRDILREYGDSFPGDFRWVPGENVGVVQSFFALLRMSDGDADYFAFSDQDDFWMSGKLSAGIRGLEELAQPEKPNLYCCRTKLVDGNLREISGDIERPPMRPAFGNALIENIATGGTIVMDRALRDMVAGRQPAFTPMHDRWCYLVASCFGNVVCDETPHICYRQHGGNVVGTSSSRAVELRQRISRFWGRRHEISRQAEEFLRIYGNLSEEEIGRHAGRQEVRENMRTARALAEGRHSLRKRVWLIRRGRLYRQRRGDDKVFKLLILLGIY